MKFGIGISITNYLTWDSPLAHDLLAVCIVSIVIQTVICPLHNYLNFF